MPQEKVFGRRTPSTLAAAPRAPSQPERALPTRKDLGFAPNDDDDAELRAFKQGYRYRRFVARGGWRWVGGVCFGVSTLMGFLDLDAAQWALGAAGAAAMLYSFRRPAKSLGAPSGAASGTS